jgi:hypothetical protein
VAYPVLAFSFLVNTNFDYRCIFFGLLIPWLLRTSFVKDSRLSARSLGVLALCGIGIVIWSEALISSVQLWLGWEVSTYFSVGPSRPGIGTVLRTIEHAITWFLMWSLCIIFFNAMRRLSIVPAYIEAPAALLSVGQVVLGSRRGQDKSEFPATLSGVELDGREDCPEVPHP